MANEILIKDGTQLLFADHATDFGSAPATAGNSLIIGTPTDVQIDLTSVGASGGARASAKTADLGSVKAGAYSVMACLVHAATPIEGEFVYFYWAPSPSATAATGNPGNVTGSDAAYTDTDGLLGQLQFIGALSLRANVLNIGYVGTFQPKHRYGSLVIVNQSAAAFHTAMDETHIAITPIISEVQ